jgi:hypothetical protein
MASAHAVIGAARDASANELIKAVTSEFETGEGRAAAREGLRTQLSGKKPSEITATALEVLKQAAAIVDAKAPRMPAPSRAGSAILPRRWRKLRRKAVPSVLAACRSAKPKRRRLPRSPQSSALPPKYWRCHLWTSDNRGWLLNRIAIPEAAPDDSRNIGR